jgi:Tfp pilus assembly protein PilF
VGDFERVEKLAKRVRQNTRYIEDINYYLALVQAAQGNTEAALELLAEVLDFNPNYYPAAQAQAQILAGTFRGPSAP